MSHHKDIPTVITQRQRPDDAGGETPLTVGTTTTTMMAKADGNGKEATSDDAGKIRGEASKQIVVDSDRDNTDILTGNDGYVAGPERWTPAKTVRTHTCVNIREIHKTEEYSGNLTERDRNETRARRRQKVVDELTMRIGHVKDTKRRARFGNLFRARQRCHPNEKGHYMRNRHSRIGKNQGSPTWPRRFGHTQCHGWNLLTEIYAQGVAFSDNFW